MSASTRTRLLAGGGLVCVSTSVGVLYKASQAATGGFKFSTTSAICMAEAAKLLMSVGIHIADPSHRREGSGVFRSALAEVRQQMSLRALLNIWLLSLLYAFNNQLSFYVYTLADPGTIFLFKSASTLIVACIQRIFADRRFTLQQWKAMLLQACGMIIVQFNPCTGTTMYGLRAYLCMCLSTAITAATAARNEYTIKSYAVGLNIQNTILYAGGVAFNLIAFSAIPNPNSSAKIGFFDGYNNGLAVGVVVANALIGLAITAVYKYADAVTKCFASDVTAVFLVIISSFIFHLKATLTTWCGVFVVAFAVHLYIEATENALKQLPLQVSVADDHEEHACEPSVQRATVNDGRRTAKQKDSEAVSLVQSVVMGAPNAQDSGDVPDSSSDSSLVARNAFV